MQQSHRSAGVPPASSPGVRPGERAVSGGETPPELAGGTPALRKRFGWPLVAALLASLCVGTLPRQALSLNDESTWAAVLNYAHQKGWQFGTDIVFTYGPLGFLASRQLFAETAMIRMIFDPLLCFLVSAGFCLAAWRLNWWFRILVIALFVYLGANIDPRTDLLIYIGLLCWGLLCLVQHKQMLFVSLASFAALAVMGILIKGNFALFAGLSALALISVLTLRGQWLAGVGLAMGLPGGLVLGWLLCGQKLGHLPLFFRNQLSIISSYDQTHGLDGLATLTTRGLLAAAFLLAAICLRIFAGLGSHDPPNAPETADDSPAPIGWERAGVRTSLCHGPNAHRKERAILFLWLCLVVALAWKHGFVRADLYHMGFFFGLAPIMALIIEVLPCERSKARLWSRLFAAGCCCLALLTLNSFFFLNLKASLLQPFHTGALTLRDLSRPTRYQRQMLEAQETIRRSAALPKLAHVIGSSTVDVFGQDAVFAILNGFNYHPRPIFQSYLANNARLMWLNEHFYLSTNRPEYVLFNLAPIDRKFAAMEDAFLLRDMLLNFELVAEENPFLLLKTKPCAAPKLIPLREGSVSLGEPIRLDDSTNNLWLEIDVEPSLLGRARQLLYKPPKIRLGVWRGGRHIPGFGFPAPPSMLAGGFVASPLLLNREDVRAWLREGTATRPQACSIEVLPDERRFWRESVRYRIYNMMRSEEVKE